MKFRLKVPRRLSVKADVEAQIEWKASGLTEALREADMTTTHYVSPERGVTILINSLRRLVRNVFTINKLNNFVL